MDCSQLVRAMSLASGVAGVLAWGAPVIAYYWPLGLGGAGLEADQEGSNKPSDLSPQARRDLARRRSSFIARKLREYGWFRDFFRSQRRPRGAFDGSDENCEI